MNRNYQKELEALLHRKGRSRPRLLLHCCCAPCSSYVLEYLDEEFLIDLYFYNPNIDPPQEYARRRDELWRLSRELGRQGKAIEEDYRPEEFYAAVQGLEGESEGGGRCRACFALRLGRAAAYAARHGYDYYATTLTISPHKNAPLLNGLGEELGRGQGVAWLPGDFKKREGYKRSLALSAQYGLYRQDYCGCVFSRRDRGKD